MRVYTEFILIIDHGSGTMQKIEAKETNDEFKNDFTIVIRLTNKKCYTLQVNNETGELEVVVKE